MTPPSFHSAAIVQKLWNYCNILRDDGLSYGDYVEQLTYLLFLKMADEQSGPPFSQAPILQQQLIEPVQSVPADVEIAAVGRRQVRVVHTHSRTALAWTGRWRRMR